MSTVPESILDLGSIFVTWSRATAAEDIVIPYPEPKPLTIYPAGIKGWFRYTGAHWGTFLPDGGSPVSMPATKLDVSGEYESVAYRLLDLYFTEGAPE